jgi:hypothetical protein
MMTAPLHSVTRQPSRKPAGAEVTPVLGLDRRRDEAAMKQQVALVTGS